MLLCAPSAVDKVKDKVNCYEFYYCHPEFYSLKELYLFSCFWLAVFLNGHFKHIDVIY